MPRRPDIPPLRRADLDPDPVAQFGRWWERALEEVPLAAAMTVATVDREGMPDARMVLLKGFDERGFCFHTHYGSAKGIQLAANPRAALVIYWRELDRQVRIRGDVERLGAEESDAYFLTRPAERRIGAWASPQSEPISDRAELERRIVEIEDRFAGEEIPRPEHWGGLRVPPQTIEFWQGAVGRLHDRFRYRRNEVGEWLIERLGP